MAQYTDLSKLIKSVVKQLGSTNHNATHLKDEVAETMSNVIKDNVYAAFTPEEYVRRGDDGGFSDTDNMVFTDVQTMGNQINLTFENITEGNDSMEGQKIADLFENGNGKWDKEVTDDEGRLNTDKRPFIEDTITELNRSKSQLTNAWKKDLKNQGFDVK